MHREGIGPGDSACESPPPPPTPDVFYPDIHVERVAFGSCHARHLWDRRLTNALQDGVPISTVWDAIASTVHPQAFLWTGDAIYPPKRVTGDAQLADMMDEYQHMLHNDTLGYSRFIQSDIVVDGVWDDHDFGGNDRGRELKNREERRDLYLDFLRVPKESARWKRDGVYSSIEFGSERRNNKVKVIFLDTRFHRERHCVPSVGSSPFIPYGAIVACTTRLITAALDLPSILPRWTSCSNDKEMLGEEQWAWLEAQLKGSTASMHVIVSSIQVLTTNPVVESWGHFPSERRRLLKLLNNVPGLVILSGDVHHAELLSTNGKSNNQLEEDGTGFANIGAVVEVTSSGLTHSCDEPFYGPLCKPILDAFPGHRYIGGNVVDASLPAYYTGRNFGSISIDWASRMFTVNVHAVDGDKVLSANFNLDVHAGLSDEGIDGVAECIDGHMRPLFLRGTLLLTAAALLHCLNLFRLRRSSSSRDTSKRE